MGFQTSIIRSYVLSSCCFLCVLVKVCMIFYLVSWAFDNIYYTVAMLIVFSAIVNLQKVIMHFARFHVFKVILVYKYNIKIRWSPNDCPTYEIYINTWAVIRQAVCFWLTLWYGSMINLRLVFLVEFCRMWSSCNANFFNMLMKNTNHAIDTFNFCFHLIAEEQEM